jgi:hypothetical protein
MSVRNYHYSLRKNPEERSSHLLLGGSLKSCVLKKNCIFIGQGMKAKETAGTKQALLQIRSVNSDELSPVFSWVRGTTPSHPQVRLTLQLR